MSLSISWFFHDGLARAVSSKTYIDTAPINCIETMIPYVSIRDEVLKKVPVLQTQIKCLLEEKLYSC